MQQMRLVEQSLHCDAQVQCVLSASDRAGMRLQQPAVCTGTGSVSSQQRSFSVRPQRDAASPTPYQQHHNSSYTASSSACAAARRRLHSSSRSPATKSEREEIRRAQQHLLQSPTVQQLFQQSSKCMQKLFDAFSAGCPLPVAALSQKAWGRLSLFLNIAPSPQMMCFFKQVAGSQMDFDAFQLAFFQLALSVHDIDARTASEEAVGRCLSQILSHCLLDDIRALRDGLHAFQSTGKQLPPLLLDDSGSMPAS